MTASVTYLGDLRTECTHIKSGSKFITDAPTDNHGKGEAFSPTDTVATGLGTCMITVMGIKARDLGVELTGSRVEVTKLMAANPRRISRIDLNLYLPINTSEKNRKILENTGLTCPVAMSLHPEIEQNVQFQWSL
jgi:uncharacterized OsmC-like protein